MKIWLVSDKLFALLFDNAVPLLILVGSLILQGTLPFSIAPLVAFMFAEQSLSIKSSLAAYLLAKVG